MKKEIKSGVIMAISFGLTLGLMGVTYATFVSVSEVNPSDTLTADLMNNVINNQKDLETRISGSAVPTGAVMAFFGTSCPTGWNEADGSGNEKDTLGVDGTLDLRGTFVRGMNGNVNSRDVVRTLGDYQADEIKSHLHSVNPPSTSTSQNGAHTHRSKLGTARFNLPSGSNNSFTSPYSYNNGSAYYNCSNGNVDCSAGAHTHTLNIPVFDSGYAGGTETRSKNVALLYCIKD